MKVKKIFYIANIRFPTERAHGIQVAHMCSSFTSQMRGLTQTHTQIDADEDLGVTLLVPDRKTIDTDPFAYYGIERNFRIEKISVPDIVRFGRIGFLIESLSFAYQAAKYIKKICVHLRLYPRSSAVLVYTREELPLLFLPRESTFYEAHQLRRSYFFKQIIRRAKGIVAITQGLKNALVKMGIPAEKILVAHDGYDEKAFAVHVDKQEARKRLALPADKKIALYIGGLEAWKGAETLCKAAAFLAKDDILVAIIGGTGEEIKGFQMKYAAVRFLGAHPYRELPVNQQAADVLVIPNSGRERISREFTSPLKLFAHMASGAPIVASRLPSLCEVLSDETAELVLPDDPQALAEGIRTALRDRAASAQKAKKAAEIVVEYSWDKRAQHVLAYIV